MPDQDIIKKLRVILPHWIEHNNNHIAEFKKWENDARTESEQEIAMLLEKAIYDMEKAGKALSLALEKIGGPLEGREGYNHVQQ